MHLKEPFLLDMPIANNIKDLLSQPIENYNGLMFQINEYKYRKKNNNLQMLFIIFFLFWNINLLNNFIMYMECCCCLPTTMTLASGGSLIFPLVVHQPASPCIWPAVQSLRWVRPQIQGWQCGTYGGAVEEMVWVLQRGNRLCVSMIWGRVIYLFIYLLSWARVQWVRPMKYLFRTYEQSGPQNKHYCTTHGNAPKGCGSYLRP